MPKIPKDWKWPTGLESLEWGAVPVRGDVSVHPAGTILGPFLHIGDWKAGVEPKFLAYLRDENYNERVKEIILKHIQENKPDSPIIQFLQTKKIKLESISKIESEDELEIFNAIQEDLACGKKILEELNALPANKKLTRYLIKQDYQDPGRLTDRVTIPIERAERTSSAKSSKLPIGLYARGHQIKRLRRKRTENKNALLESLATKIANVTGMATQEQGLVFGTYKDGHPKLMTVTKWQEGLCTFEGLLAGGSKKEGSYFVEIERDNNGNPIKDEDGNFKLDQDNEGYYRSNRSITDLGEHLALVIRQGDRDVLGSEGGNKGYVGNKLFGIDFGQAYRKENQLVKTLQDDFSFVQPSETFKNISAFYDNPYSEKMKGIYFLQKQRTGKDPPPEIMKSYGAEFERKIKSMKQNGDLEIFDEYIKKAEALTAIDPAYLHLAGKIRLCRERALAADTEILKIFEQRLQLTTIDELNFVDGLEKLLSETSHLSPIGTDFFPGKVVKLNHLRVLPKTRVECQLFKNKEEGKNIISISVKNEDDSKNILNKLKKFDTQSLEDVEVKYNKENNKLEIKCTNEQLKIIMKKFTENEIANYKKQPTISSEKAKPGPKPLIIPEFEGVRGGKVVGTRDAADLKTNQDKTGTVIPEKHKAVVKGLIQELLKPPISKLDSIEDTSIKFDEKTYDENRMLNCSFSGRKVIEAAEKFYKDLNAAVSVYPDPEIKNVKITPPSYTLKVSEKMSDAAIMKLLEKSETTDPKIEVTRIISGSKEPEAVEEFKERLSKAAEQAAQEEDENSKPSPGP